MSPFLLFHLVWDFLSPDTRQVVVAMHPIMDVYARRRLRTFTLYSTIRTDLARQRPPLDEITPLCHRRAEFLACALLSFDFHYGDLLRWMGNDYTQSYRDFAALHTAYEAVRHIPPNPGEPTPDFDRAFRVQTEGVPLRGAFTCPFNDVVRRIHYDNHAPLNDALEDVRKKLGKEESKSYHIVFPRSVAYFIDGLFIAFMNWVVQKGKGRIVVDPSTHIDGNDLGALNDSIPKPGCGHPDESPPITFANAFVRHLIHIWNLRISYPREEILQHTDDIEAAFHRIQYHPDLGICFAYVFMEFLIVPIGTIFGAGDSPGWFGLTAEARTHLGNVKDYAATELPLADEVVLPAPPTDVEIASFAPAVADSSHQGIPPALRDRHWHSMFVDDKATADTLSRMRSAIRSGVGSAYENYGHPDHDRRGPVLPRDKFSMLAAVRTTHLGMLIDTRLLAVAWPLDKLRRMRSILDDWVLTPRDRTAHEAASLLGLARHGAPLSNIGIFWSIRLQRQLSTIVQRSGSAAIKKKRWWRFQKLPVDRGILQDLDIMRRTLPQPTEVAPDPFHFWCRPIGLMIPREANGFALSDASYGGLGGWSTTWSFMWRLTREDLIDHGFDMRAIDAADEDLHQFHSGFPDDARGLHINVLELFGILINTWLVLFHVRRSTPPIGGWIVTILADNTSALSWFHFAARSHRSPIVSNLTSLCQAMIAFSNTDQFTRLQGTHLPGRDNGPADALSRPSKFPSVDSAIKVYSQLQTCRYSLLPSALLSMMARIAFSNSTAAGLVHETTILLTLEPRFLPVGSIITASTKNVWRRFKRRRSRR